MTNRPHIIVLGSGPAGCLSAINLRKSGYRVTIIGNTDTRAMLEGLGPRTLQAMKFTGCPETINHRIGPSVPRLAIWAGQQEQVNFEYVIDRPMFDEGLRIDAKTAGAKLLKGQVQTTKITTVDCTVRYQNDNGNELKITGDFIVEARGRKAPKNGFRSRQGSNTVAMVTMWQLPNKGDAFTSVAPFCDGWAWLAKPGDGRAVLQISISGEKGDIPGKTNQEQFFAEKFNQVTELKNWLQGAKRVSKIVTRISGSIIKGGLIGDRSIRIGDAAVAGDPLSGHGIYYAASAALALPAIINTLLNPNQDSTLAQRFYLERTEETLEHHARAGRDHYSRETRWSESPFWHARQNWPPVKQATTKDNNPAIVDIRPVIDGDYVQAREVIITHDHPRGVWSIDNVNLVSLLRFLQAEHPSSNNIIDHAVKFTGNPKHQVSQAVQWLIQHALLQSSG